MTYRGTTKLPSFDENGMPYEFCENYGCTNYTSDFIVCGDNEDKRIKCRPCFNYDSMLDRFLQNEIKKDPDMIRRVAQSCAEDEKRHKAEKINKRLRRNTRINLKRFLPLHLKTCSPFPFLSFYNILIIPHLILLFLL